MLDDFRPAVSVQETVWQIASQLGKTLCLIIGVEYYIERAPTGILIVYPTKDSGRAWSVKKFTPTVNATPKMQGLLSDPRSRDAENTVFNKSFPGGDISIAGANSATTLRQQSKEVIICDELDAFRPNVEGDPEEQADKRAETFSGAIKIKSSTPTLKGLSRVEDKFLKSDQQRWFVPCPKCGQFQFLEWSMLRWNKGKPETAFMQCKHCRKHWTDTDRIRAIHKGEWRATKPFTGIRGRHLNGLYRLMGKKDAFKNYLHEFVDGFLRAKRKGRFALMVWTNTFLAETFEEFKEKLDDAGLAKRREDYTATTIPAPALVVTAGVDVQGDRLEMLVKAWAPGEEAFGIEYRVFPGNPLRPEVWAELASHIETARFRTKDGRELRILSTAVDSGAFTETVYEFCKPRFSRRIMAVKGSNQAGDPIVGTLSRNNRKRCPVYRVGTHTAKLTIYSRLQLEKPGPGFYHYTRDPIARFDETFFAGVTSEEITVKYNRGFPMRVFVLPEGRRNEPLDLEVYCLAALLILNPSWDALTRALEESKPGQSEKNIESAAVSNTLGQDSGPSRPARSAFRPRKNWVKRW